MGLYLAIVNNLSWGPLLVTYSFIYMVQTHLPGQFFDHKLDFEAKLDLKIHSFIESDRDFFKQIKRKIK